MNKYNSYKDSGLEWIGEIPKHWKELPLRYYFDYTKGSNGQKLNKTYIEENKGEYPVYSGQTTKNGILGYVNEYEFDYSFPLVFTTTVGAKFMNTRILQGKFSLSQNCLVMIRKKICIPSYFQYLLSIDFEFRRELIPTIIQPSLRMEDLDRMTIIIPTLSEQQQIVTFLDDKTQKIDSLLQQKEKKIELLKEKRTSLINHVVTKGLDSNVEMKDSGVEWIGDIPSSWKITKLKYEFNISGGGTPSKEKPEYWDGDIPWVSPKDMKSRVISKTQDFTTILGVNNSSTKLIKETSLLMVVRSGILQHTIPICFNSVPVTINQDLKSFEEKKDMTIYYLFYLIKGHEKNLLLEWSKDGTTVESIEMDFMMNSELPIPPNSEQQQIVEYLDEQTEEIDTLIQLEQKKIDTLKEYRQSLISEVVTGKIRVCEEDNSLSLNPQTV